MTAEWGAVTRTRTLDAVDLSARAARRLVRDACRAARVAPETTETALLLVSELVTNAVTHGAADPVLQIEVREQLLRVAVTDDGTGEPRVSADNPPLAEGGRGLFLVDTLSARWGVDPRRPRGKTVWFELEPGRPRA